MKNPRCIFIPLMLAVSSLVHAQDYKATKCAGGTEHTLVLLQNGDLTACGLNGKGRLGLAKSVYNVTRPRKIATDVSDIACGYEHSIYVSGGSAYAFGANDSGQLGTGDTASGPSRRKVLNGVSAVAAGDDFSFFLMEDGSVRATGRNIYGQLGIGNFNNRKSPTPVTGLPPIKAIACGKDHTLFLARDGRVFGCGANASGQLGLGDDVYRSSPTRIPGLPAIRKISAGIGYSLFLTDDDDEAWGCGYNVDGQIFAATKESYLNAARLFKAGTKVVDLAAGSAFSLYIVERDTGRVLLGRGNNAYNQLGIGAFGPAEREPVLIDMNAPQAVFATYYNGFVRSSYQLKPYGPLQFVTGYNSQGQAGTGNTTIVATPTPMLLVSPSIIHTSPGDGSMVSSTYRNGYLITNAPYAGAVRFRQTGNGTSIMKEFPKHNAANPVIERSLINPVAGNIAEFTDFVQVLDRSGRVTGSHSITRQSKFAWSDRDTKMTFQQLR